MHCSPRSGQKRRRGARLDEATLLFPLPTLLHIFGDSDFGRGAHRVDASVGVAGVGPLIRRLHVVQDQAAVRRCLDVATVGTHGDAVPATEQWEVSLENKKDNKTYFVDFVLSSEFPAKKK